MAFPKSCSNRDFSLYSSSITNTDNEGSVRKANQDLERCAYILNQVLDNDSGILDSIKKRKYAMPSQPEKNRNLRQTNKRLFITASEDKCLSYVQTLDKIAASTPSSSKLGNTRRKRSSSACSVTSSQGSHRQKHRRNRSLSEQRTLSSCKRNCRSIQRSIDSSIIQRPHVHADSTNSVMANASAVSSEADTLTGIHLDNSSLFGVPPVFNAGGRRRVKKASFKAQKEKPNEPGRNVIWLKPQMSISTQTQQVEPNKYAGADNSDTQPSSTTANKEAITRNTPEIKETNGAINHSQHEKDFINNNTELTQNGGMKLEEVTPKQSFDEALNQNSLDVATFNENSLEGLLTKLRHAYARSDSTEFAETVAAFALVMRNLVRKRDIANIDLLLLPFQRETQQLKEEIAYLKLKLYEQQQQIQRSTTNQQAEADAQVMQLSQLLENQKKVMIREEKKLEQLTQEKNRYKEQADSLVKENQTLLNKLSTFTTSKVPVDELSNSSQRLRYLQKAMRLIHTRITGVSSTCDSKTSKQLTAILEFCSQELLSSLSDEPHLDKPENPHVVNTSKNNNVSAFPPTLAKVVSSNLMKSRHINKGMDSHAPLSSPKSNTTSSVNGDSRCSLTDYFHKYHPESSFGDIQSSSSEILSSDSHTRYRNKQKQAPVHTTHDGSFFNPKTDFKKTEMLSQFDHGSSTQKLSSSSLPTSSSTNTPPPGILHSTLVSDDDTLSVIENIDDVEVTSSSSVNTLIADSAFQEGLAKLDANIARLQESLRLNMLSTTF